METMQRLISCKASQSFSRIAKTDNKSRRRKKMQGAKTKIFFCCLMSMPSSRLPYVSWKTFWVHSDAFTLQNIVKIMGSTPHKIKFAKARQLDSLCDINFERSSGDLDNSSIERRIRSRQEATKSRIYPFQIKQWLSLPFRAVIILKHLHMLNRM